MKNFVLHVIFLFFGFHSMSQVTIDIQASEDTYIDQTIPNGNFGSADQLRTKPFAPSWSERFLLKFDLSSIPAGAEIIGAQVSLTITNYLWVSSTIRAYRINGSWSEHSVTWANFSNQYESAYSAQRTCAYPAQNLGSKRTWNLLSDVQAMHSGTIANNGWFFRDRNLNSSSQAYWNFASRENVSITQRPVLQVTYLDFNPLPVELLGFSGNCDDGPAELSWQTASEHNSSHFTVDWSRDGTTWEEIEIVNAAGFSNSTQNYSISHIPPISESSYYRLSQYDTDGAFEVYEDKIIELNCKGEYQQQVTVYPNPNSGAFNILIRSENTEAENSQLDIVDTRGSIVKKRNILLNEGINIYAINTKLKPGVYYVKVTSENLQIQPLKFTIN